MKSSKELFKMLVKELIAKLKEFPEDLPVFYIADGHYTDVNKFNVVELHQSKWNVLLPTEYYKGSAFDNDCNPFDALIIDSAFKR